jgi:hypothetical protein
LIPPDLRMPNTPLWIRFDDDWMALRVWRRQEGELYQLTESSRRNDE